MYKEVQFQDQEELTKQQQELKKLMEEKSSIDSNKIMRELTVKEICNMFDISRPTLYKVIG